MINDILDFSKLEAGKLTLNSIDFSLQSVIGGVVSAARDHRQRQGRATGEFVERPDARLAQGRSKPDLLRSCSISPGNAIKTPSRVRSASWRRIANCPARSSKFA